MPALSDVTIANSALSLIGDQRIVSLTDDSEAAKAINANYDLIRDEVTAAHPWNCAIHRVEVASTTTTPVYGFTNTFNLPTDPWCLRILEIQNFDHDEWVVEGRTFLVDASSVNIRYVKRITDAMEMSPGLVQAISARLAHAVCFRLTGDEDLRGRIWQYYTQVRRDARSTDGLEGAPPLIESSTFATARL